MGYGSKYIGWLAALGIVLGAGWFLLPQGYELLIQWLAPTLGNYIRPTLVLVSVLLVNPLTNLVMAIVWAAAGLIGGIIAGTKKGAIVVGIITWFSCLGILGFCIYNIWNTGLDLGSIPPIPEGYSIVDVLSIPLVQGLIADIFTVVSGFSGGGSPSLVSMITPFLIYLFSPLIIIIAAGMCGAIVRPKGED
jgi:hypothetical protein